ncbi:nitrite reductase small subunit NirD [sulfur-oxidizing endosymbiont of Gigantopelta aegis]|uniref:nitrite reductase small subunit NirD n=1 Tax=sulfur-oxidizing endosymbiont of Gigantopelta aegis TaxID=2794934 RepID=UPI0018DDCD88|nr:nitrite reductase small subunit NirD [sulfur-oxidizing endosymbiont of Gigantopelta aegis]
MSNWIEVGQLDEIPQQGSRIVKTADFNIAVFRTVNDEVFAIKDSCPHKQGQLSQGIVHGNKVTCPLHNWTISLESGEALGPDEGCTNVFATKVEDGLITIDLG